MILWDPGQAPDLDCCRRRTTRRFRASAKGLIQADFALSCRADSERGGWHETCSARLARLSAPGRRDCEAQPPSNAPSGNISAIPVAAICPLALSACSEQGMNEARQSPRLIRSLCARISRLPI